MSGLTSFRLRWMRLVGSMPSASRIEAQRQALESRYGRYRGYKESRDYARYQELKELVESGAVQRAKEKIALDTYKGSREESVLTDLKALRKDRDVRAVLRGKGDPNNASYQRFEKLRQEAESDAFKARIRELQDKKRFENSEMGQAEREYKQLQSSRELKWFEQQTQKGTFDELDRRQELFFDHFEGSALDKSRWLTRFFWGEALLQKPFSLMGDPHCYTDGQNVRVEGSVAVIETRHEPMQAMAWDTKLGFMPKKFDYTSGLLCTGHSFRMQHGRVEAKVRFTAEPGAYHALYLVGDKMSPQIDLFRSNPEDPRLISGVYSHGSFSTSGRIDARTQEETVGKLPFESEFFILSVELEPGKITWAINSVPYMERTADLPKEPLYLVIASGVVPGATPQGTSRLEVDWVRCVSALE